MLRRCSCAKATVAKTSATTTAKYFLLIGLSLLGARYERRANLLNCSPAEHSRGPGCVRTRTSSAPAKANLWSGVDRLRGHGPVHAREHFADRLRAVARLALLLLEAFHHPLVAAVPLRVGEAFGQCRALLERLERAPECFLQRLRLRAEHRFRR